MSAGDEDECCDVGALLVHVDGPTALCAVPVLYNSKRSFLMMGLLPESATRCETCSRAAESPNG